MPLHQIQIEGAHARSEVRRGWPEATSTYTDTHAAQIYDAATGAVLGEAIAQEFSVEHAWIAAARGTHTPQASTQAGAHR